MHRRIFQHSQALDVVQLGVVAEAVEERLPSALRVDSKENHPVDVMHEHSV